jgi:hypothetical protein
MTGGAPLSGEVKRVSTDHTWSGYLTLENLQAVADRISALLGNGRRFTTVVSNEGMQANLPEVRTGRVLHTITVHDEREKGIPAGTIVLSADAMSDWTTHAPDRPAARALERTRRPPHFHITHDTVRVTDRVPAGHRTYEVFSVEENWDLRELHKPEVRIYAHTDPEEPEHITVCSHCTTLIERGVPAGQGSPVTLWPCDTATAAGFGQADTVPAPTGAESPW